MRHFLPSALLCMSAIGAQQVSFDRWWSHVVYLADDALEGRQPFQSVRPAPSLITAPACEHRFGPPGEAGIL